MARGMKTTAKKTTAKKMMNGGKMSKPKKMQFGGSTNSAISDSTITRIVGNKTGPSGNKEMLKKLMDKSKSKESEMKAKMSKKTT